MKTKQQMWRTSRQGLFAVEAGHLAGTHLGQKLKSVRIERGKTLKEVAVAVGCSESQLSKIENNQTLPSLPLLHGLVLVLDTNIAWLFETDDRGATIIDREGTRPRIHLDSLRRGAGLVLERIIPYSKTYQLQCNIHHVEPFGASEGMITHEGEEVGYVLEGSVDLIIEDTVYSLSKGDLFYFPSLRPHGYRNPSPSPASIFWVNTPPTF